MHKFQWVEPAPLWSERSLSEIETPQLIQIASDNFLAEFLAAMQPPRLPVHRYGLPAPSTASPTSTTYLAQRRLEASLDPQSAVKLFQPLHGRFYLVTASLICFLPGLPDKTVNVKKGERVSFVLRRQRQNQEQGWTEQGGWRAVTDRELLRDEEQFPMHPVNVCTGSENNGLMPCERSVYYGYVAVGSRDKYLDKLKPTAATEDKPAFPDLNNESASPAERVRDFFTAAYGQSPAPDRDYRLDEFDTRVIANWKMLVEKKDNLLSQADKVKEISLQLVLDLGDFLARALPRVWEAIKVNNVSGLSRQSETQPNQRNGKRLFFEINYFKFNLLTVGEIILGDALRIYQADIEANAARGEVEYFHNLTNDLKRYPDYDLRIGNQPNIPFDVDTDPDDPNFPDLIAGITYTAIVPGSSYLDGMQTPKDSADPDNPFKAPGELITLVKDALDEVKAGNNDQIPAMPFALGAQTDAKAREILALIKHMVRPIRTQGGIPAVNDYFLRLVYQYDPDCPPVMSHKTIPFQFAGAFDPDAPARFVRIEAPSIRPADLRKFTKGVGIQMSPELNDVTNRVHEGMLEGEGLNPSGGLGITFICTFSIQIIFLVALIVMFIFLILLNIVFWWLAFIKICLPVPTFEEG